MPFDKFLSKISGQKEVFTLEDFQEKLDLFISKIEQKHKASKIAEQEFQQKYDEKLSKLDFNGSKRAVENSRHQLAESLELNVQLDFLKNIRLLSKGIPEKKLKKINFRQMADDIFNSKKINSQSYRRIILTRFKKFVPSADDILLTSTESEEDIDRILQEVKEGKQIIGSIDNEVEKIIEEVKRKKDDK
ncbi:MAG: hypothetical protein ACFFB5_06505 [Promethearchaeota archaeon]